MVLSAIVYSTCTSYFLSAELTSKGGLFSKAFPFALNSNLPFTRSILSDGYCLNDCHCSPSFFPEKSSERLSAGILDEPAELNKELLETILAGTRNHPSFVHSIGNIRVCLPSV